MKKYSILLLILLVLILVGCNDTENPPIIPDPPINGDNGDNGDNGQGEIVVYDFEMPLPSTELLADATNIEVVEGAPELMILEVVLDTEYYYHYETMSGYEYLKVFNNTTEDYNLKNHRIVLANPIQGQNIEDEQTSLGNKALVTGFLFLGLIDEDFIIPSLSIGLIWLKPYYWTIGSGSNAFNKPFSANVIHKDNSDQQGAISQTISEFKQFWKIETSEVPVYCLTNMGLIGKRPEGGTEDLFPIYSPASGTPYTHLNSRLLRSIEIQKFNDQGGTASISLLNKYSALSDEKQKDPDFIYGKKCFNVMEVRDNQEVVDAYDYLNCWKYFDPVIRVNFCGRVDVTTMTTGQTYVDFGGASNPGVLGWDNSVGLQFRPPLPGERIMQLQLPLREYKSYQTYMNPTQLSVMRFSAENVTDYRYITKTIKLIKDPSLGLELINWRTDEVASEGRRSCAAPDKIKAINLSN
ncbi:MAG: hypothetical protein PHX62_04875 [Bacilli bacterium]|nr:hypothetical protein [Bacilli bacterium]